VDDRAGNRGAVYELGVVTMPSMMAMMLGECDCKAVELKDHDDFCVVWESVDREDVE